MRIWYKNHHGECVTVAADNRRPAEYLIHQKVFMTKLSYITTTTTPEEAMYHFPFLAIA